MNITEIIQIGAGGTGSWFARVLMHNLVEARRIDKDFGGHIEWSVWDPDIVEARNLVRQPFYSGVGKPKALYTKEMLSNFFAYNKLTGIEVESHQSIFDDMERLSSYSSGNLCTIVVSCVDNTYTRGRVQKHLADNCKNGERMAYLDMGVAPDGDWSMDFADIHLMVPLKYDKVTYPDQLLSCSERDEIGPVPQTTFSNVAAGSNAAQTLIEYIAVPRDLEAKFHKSLYGTSSGEVKRLTLEDYYRQRI